MQISIKVINGPEHTIEVASDLSIEALKKQLADELKIPINQQRLMYKGKSLSDTSTLNDYLIEPGTKIHLIIKKDTESTFSKELKLVCKKYVIDLDQFSTIFNQELKNLVNEMSLDDIERYDELKEKIKNQNPTKNSN